jgi:hypothetical protein
VQKLPTAVAVMSKECTLFYHWVTGIVGSNTTRSMDECQCFLCVCVVLCRWRPRDGQISRPRSLSSPGKREEKEEDDDNNNYGDDKYFNSSLTETRSQLQKNCLMLFRVIIAA